MFRGGASGRKVRFQKRRIREALFLLSCLFLGIVLLRPVGGEKGSFQQAEGIDTIFVVDVSQSMRALDFSDGRKNVDRLEMSKRMMRKFVEEHPEHRYGLVVFAGEAFTVSPLTFDHETFLTFLEGISPEDVVKQGTNLESALTEMTNRFTSAGDEERGRLAVLITDGEEQKGNYEGAAKRAKKEGITLLMVGIGSKDGSRIPEGTDLFGNVLYKTHQGEMVLTRLNEAPLKEIAKLTDGVYLHPTSESEFLAISDTVDTLKKTKIEVPVPTEGLSEQYEIFAKLAFLCFLLGILIPFSPHAMQRNLVFLLLPLLFSGCDITKTPFAYSTNKGNTAYLEKDWKKADFEYQTAEQVSPSDEMATAKENRGLVAFEKQEYETAQSFFEEAEKSCPPKEEHCADASYHLGNTLYRLGEKEGDSSQKKTKWESAISAYDRALARNSEDKEAKENKEFVQKKLEELQKQQEEKKNGKQNQQGEDKKGDSDQKNQQKDSEKKSEDKKGEEGEDSKNQGGEGTKQQENNSQEQKLSEDMKQEIERYLQELDQTEQDTNQFFDRFGQGKSQQQDPFLQQFFEQDPFFQDGTQKDPNEKDW